MQAVGEALALGLVSPLGPATAVAVLAYMTGYFQLYGRNEGLSVRLC